MSVLNDGGEAVNAVETAIMVLENKEITNAGYGSNLSMDGTVECDATIVDHHGRSGAVGAVGQVLHPIHLARLVLDYSTRPLSLRRVPPNLLCGPGATSFAASLQVPVVPPARLVSNAAHDRWIKWSRDLKVAESRIELARAHTIPTHRTQPSQDQQTIGTPQASPSTLGNDFISSEAPIGTLFPPALPKAAVDLVVKVEHRATPPSKRMGMDAASTPTPLHVHWAGQRSGSDGEAGQTYADDSEEIFVDEDPPLTRPIPMDTDLQKATPADYSRENGREDFTLAAIPTPVLENTNPLHQDHPFSSDATMSEDNEPRLEPVSLGDDITDTVGAIAIDHLGNIAAGSSSGGIGMKHRGRIGPAALVGIGTAVIPMDPQDSDKTSVATVTSGTGEHMATTMAATTCANRLYTGTRKSRGGGSESTDDDTAVKGFIEQDFMGHPSVKNSYSAGGIGVLGVKKTTDGVWLYFAHNTDSFAMASMSSEETKPRSVMSRSKDTDKVVSGGRPVKYHRVSSWTSNHHPSVWPPNLNAEAAPSSSSDQPASKRQKRMRVPPTGTQSDPVEHVGGQEMMANTDDGYKVAFEKKMRENEGKKNVLAEKVAVFRARERRRGDG
ncbi:MAG: hypothetical protein Q9183_002649 [Haloplaca sp. 2 TL-2023]